MSALVFTLWVVFVGWSLRALERVISSAHYRRSSCPPGARVRAPHSPALPPRTDGPPGELFRDLLTPTGRQA